MSTIPKYIIGRNGGGGGGGGSLNPEDLKTVGYDSLIKDPMMPVGNVEFGYQQAAQGYPGGYLHVGQQRVAMRTINGEPLIGNTDIVITPGDANMVPITYAALKALRDNKQLVPGTWYRITDYECTTISPGTISAQHPFDIVVLATGSDTLDENAFACRHAGDSYFTGEHIEAWRLKYCLDNDTSRFGWAKETLIPYIVIGGDTFYLSHEGISWEYRRFDPVMGDLFMFTSPNPSVGDFAFENSDLTGRSLEITDVSGQVQVGGKGVIYWMRDEWGNEAPYDFKNICFARWAVSDLKSNSLSAEVLQSLIDIFVYDSKDNPFFFGLQDTDYTQGGLTFDIDHKTDPAYYYTFGGDTDRSLNGGANGCYGNVIKPWIDNLGVQQLNNGVWVKTDGGKVQNHHSTTCGYNCHGWTCGNYCYGWTCGNGCCEWTCGNECCEWTCGNDCNGWTCGNDCYSWTCGNECYEWTCGNECYEWTCGNNCHDWTCGNNCHDWTCGNNCHDWTCGNNCHDWTCGNYCYSWTCGNGCYDWTCGNACYSWTCGNYCYSWTCGNYCYSWTCGNYCYFWTCGNYYRAWTCGNGCSYWDGPTYGSASAYYENFHLMSGTSGTSQSRLDLSTVIGANVPYSRYIGFNTQGVLKNWVPADLAP